MRFLAILNIFCLIFTAEVAQAAWLNVNRGMVNQSTNITKNGTISTLVQTSNQVLYFTGAAAQEVVLPDAQTLPDDWWYEFVNTTTGDITVKDYAGGTVATVAAFRNTTLLLRTKATAAGTWYQSTNSVTGTTSALSYASFSATSPLTYDGAGVFAIPLATGSANGYLSSADWLRFDASASLSPITALTGDVTATGPGSVAATVVTVGGETAAEVATSVQETQAATATNTPSTIVRRDSSGNFSAGEITADLVGDVTGNADTATAFATAPTGCGPGEFAEDIDAQGNLTCSPAAGGGDVVGPASSTDNAIAIYDGLTGKLIKNSLATIDGSGNITANSFVGNADTATALAAAPTGCAPGEFAEDIDAQGNLTCSTPAGGGDVVGPASSTDNGLAVYDDTTGKLLRSSTVTESSGVLTATGFSGPLTGNADTATALAANPTDCGVGEFANAIAASGDLTCATPAAGGITELTGDVTAGPGSGAQAATIANDAVTDAKLRESTGLSVIGRSANSTGNPADIVAANDGEVLRRSGTSVGFGDIGFGALPQLASGELLANSTGSTADVAATTVTSLLDRAFSSVQGSVLYRGASAWLALSPGTSGHFLQTQGAGANPQWAAGGGGGAGNVESTYAGTVKVAWMRIAAACSGTCTVTEQSGDFNAPTQNSTGSYAGTFTGSPFATAPICVANGEDDQVHAAVLSITTSGFQLRSRNTTGTFEDRAMDVFCIGKND